MRYFSFLFFIFITLNADINTERFASFSISNGDLELENGNYLESIDLYRSAYEASNNHEIKAQALLREANLFSIYLDEKLEAISLYKKLIDIYPNVSTVEYATYSLALLYKDIGKRDESISMFKFYLKHHENGKFSNQIKFILSRLITSDEIQAKKNPLLISDNKTIPLLRVLLLNTDKTITLSSKDSLYIDGKKYKTLKVSYKDNKIEINSKKYFKLIIKSNTPIYVSKEKKKYTGDMLLTTYKHKLALINIVPINEYLYGVVTSESYNKWDIEALKAQAIASRTYAYYQSKVRKNWIFDIKDNTSDQVYNGVNAQTSKSIKAVDDTFGMVLLSNDKIIFSQYTASSGWYSASSNEIFNTKKKYLLAHKDKFSKVMPNGQWDKRINIKFFEDKLNKQGFNFKNIYALEPIKIGESGRILSMKIKADNGEKVLRTYSTIRRAAGLKDILFKVRKEGNYFIFDGGGYGHGVGYSQWGGQKMALNGYKYDEILQFYYNSTDLKKLW